MTLWKSRINSEMSSAFKEMNKSLDFDIRLLPHEIKQNVAYATALNKVGVIKNDELKSIEKALLQILDEYNRGEYIPLPDEEDVHSLVEARLTELTGDVGKKIHTGRSRNEVIATDIKMFLVDEIGNIKDAISPVVAEIVKLAEENINVAMPGFTHMQHAQPIRLSHYLCSFAYSLIGDFNRLDRILESGLSECPMGSGSFAGSAFNIDREKIAKDLGFARPTPNSITAVSQRDELLEVASALSILMIHLSRYAEDFIMWSTSEFGYIELGENVSTGSSMMPQKKNPDSLELIRGKTARVIGNMQTLFTLLKGMPLTYSRDLQEDKPPLFDSIDETKLCLNVFKNVFETVKINKENMESKIENMLFATDLADYLAKKGVPYRDAYGIVGNLTCDSLEAKKDFGAYTLEELKQYSKFFEKDVFDCFSAERGIESRDIMGGTGPASVKAQIKDLQDWPS